MATKLPEFNGYTVDVRLKQFRKVSNHNSIEFVDFDSKKGKRIFAEYEKMKKELENLTEEDFFYINCTMRNNEVSSDKELIDLFMEELKVSKALAKKIVSFRAKAWVEMDFDIRFYLEVEAMDE